MGEAHRRQAGGLILPAAMAIFRLGICCLTARIVASFLTPAKKLMPCSPFLAYIPCPLAFIRGWPRLRTSLGSTISAVMALIMFCMILLPACAASFPFTKKSSAMNSSFAIKSSVTEPKLDVNEVGQRFLKLIEGLYSQAELSLEKVEKAMNIKLSHLPQAGRYAYSKEIENGWHYALWYIPETSSYKNGIRLMLAHVGRSSVGMPPACVWRFDDYHDALQAMGFTTVPLHDEIGRLQSWRYSKYSPADGRVSIALTITPQNIVPGEDGPLCIKSIATIN